MAQNSKKPKTSKSDDHSIRRLIVFTSDKLDALLLLGFLSGIHFGISLGLKLRYLKYMRGFLWHLGYNFSLIIGFLSAIIATVIMIVLTYRFKKAKKIKKRIAVRSYILVILFISSFLLTSWIVHGKTILYLLIIGLISIGLYLFLGFLFFSSVKIKDERGTIANKLIKSLEFLKASDIYRRLKNWLKAGECYEEVDEYNLAIDMYRQVNAWDKIASIFDREGKTADAIKYYIQARLFERAAKVALSAGEEEKAAELLIKAKKYKDAGEIYYSLENYKKAGKIFEKAKDYSEAARAYEKAGELKKAAKLYEDSKNIEKAARLFEKMGELNRAALLFRKINDLETALRLGIKTKNSDLVVEVYKMIDISHVKDLSCKNKEILAELLHKKGMYNEAGDIYYKLKDYENAGKMFEKGNEYHYAADSYERAGEILKAAELYERVKEYIKSAKLFEKIGNLSKSANLYKIGQDYESALNLSLIAMDAPLATEMLKILGNTVKRTLSKKDKKILVNLLVEQKEYEEAGKICFELKEYEKAGDMFEKANEYYRAAESYERAGEVLKAAELYELAAEYEKSANLFEKEDNLLRAAELYEKAEKYEKAAELYKKSKKYRKAGELFREVHNYKFAAKMFKKARDNKNAALMYLELSEKENAAKYFAKAEVYKEAADLFLGINNLRAAADNYEKGNYNLQAAKCFMGIPICKEVLRLCTKISEWKEAYKLVFECKDKELAKQIIKDNEGKASISDIISAYVEIGEQLLAFPFCLKGKIYDRASQICDEIWEETGYNIRDVRIVKLVEHIKSFSENRLKQLVKKINPPFLFYIDGDFIDKLDDLDKLDKAFKRLSENNVAFEDNVLIGKFQEEIIRLPLIDADVSIDDFKEEVDKRLKKRGLGKDLYSSITYLALQYEGIGDIDEWLIVGSKSKDYRYSEVRIGSRIQKEGDVLMLEKYIFYFPIHFEGKNVRSYNEEICRELKIIRKQRDAGLSLRIKQIEDTLKASINEKLAVF